MLGQWITRARETVKKVMGVQGGSRPALMRILNPLVRDRWRVGRVADYTPDRIEIILRGAFAGDIERQWELFDLMEETWPRLQKNLTELKGALEECDWTVQAWAAKGKEPSAEAIRRAQLLEDAIWHCTPDPTRDENDWQDTLRDLADAWGKGVSILELHWELRPYESGTLVGLRASHWVHPRYYGWPTGGGDTQDQLMLRVRELPGAAVPIGANSEWLSFPREKFLIGIAKQKTGHPIGASLLRTLAWWWCASTFSAEWMLNLAQIFGVPIRWATYSTNAPAEVKRTLEEMLENMGSQGWAAFPEGTTLDIKEGIRSATHNPQAVMHELSDRVCDLLILGQTLTSDVGNSGSRALGDVHQGILTGRKKALVGWVVKVLNQQFVPAFCQLNFGDTAECPYFLAGEDGEEDAKALAERDSILARLGVEFPKGWFLERHKIPMPEAGEETIGGPAEPETTPGTATAKAKSTDEKLADAVLEQLTHVEAKWLAGVKPYFVRLVQQAQDGNLSDEDFERAVMQAQREIPDLFHRLDTHTLQTAMEHAMGAAVINGAVQGALRRGVGKRRR